MKKPLGREEVKKQITDAIGRKGYCLVHKNNCLAGFTGVDKAMKYLDAVKLIG